MAEIVITEFMEQSAVSSLAADFDCLYDPRLVDDAGRIHAMLADCRGLIVRNRTRVDAAMMDAAPNRRVIGRLGVGLDNIDLDAAAERGGGGSGGSPRKKNKTLGPLSSSGPGGRAKGR